MGYELPAANLRSEDTGGGRLGRQGLGEKTTLCAHQSHTYSQFPRLVGYMVFLGGPVL